jgi:hypothetical protein
MRGTYLPSSNVGYGLVRALQFAIERTDRLPARSKSAADLYVRDGLNELARNILAKLEAEGGEYVHPILTTRGRT